jgi:pimeloyl-ACP methyl ester carboxylesterase
VRSDKALEKKGPADVVFSVIEALKLENSEMILVGYDWGGATALRMAAAWPKIFKKVIAFHPAIASS